jgi:hypothetical protein
MPAFLFKENLSNNVALGRHKGLPLRKSGIY